MAHGWPLGDRTGADSSPADLQSADLSGSEFDLFEFKFDFESDSLCSAWLLAVSFADLIVVVIMYDNAFFT